MTQENRLLGTRNYTLPPKKVKEFLDYAARDVSDVLNASEPSPLRVMRSNDYAGYVWQTTGRDNEEPSDNIVAFFGRGYVKLQGSERFRKTIDVLTTKLDELSRKGNKPLK